ncbi:T6SS phospholipase effector Tle1-like catalytic domain-containing protein [Pseudomonas fulva]|nr:DUF2235 domain-containing protein [Pseudomonas fulva]MBF8781643.1 DUF2235 domain-containing protein [Pseudomonas fulva]
MIRSHSHHHLAGQNTLRIGIFFDGTGNHRGNSQAGANASAPGSYGNALTNIALLHELYADSRRQPCAVPGRACLAIYVEGVGTLEGQPDSMLAQATGRGRTGIAGRVRQACQATARQVHAWQAGHAELPLARLEFDLFGFSRGAAAARHFANELDKGEDSLLTKALANLAGHGQAAIRLAGRASINFIGLFDTVEAVVAPITGRLGTSHRLQLGLADGLARRTVQLVAADEHRHNFPLVRTAHDIVMPGAHSDIGGGYHERMTERVLLCKPRSTQVPASLPVQQSAAYRAVLALQQSGADDLAQARIVTWEVPLPSQRDKHDLPQKRVYVALQREREVLGHLSRIYLRIMRELALRADVPFAALDEAHERYRLPEELESVSRKLHGFALGERDEIGLDEAQKSMLRARYIHASAHWNPLKGLRNSELDALYVDRPAEGGRRVVE